MSRHVRARLACAALVVALVHPAHAGPLSLDLPTAVARARERAPEAIAALARIDEARAKRIGAGVFTHNPELSVGGGPRFGDPRRLSLQAQLSQQLEPGRRGARIRAADAAIDHARALGEAELRALDLSVADAFLEARFAELAIDLAQRDLDLATRAVEAAKRRRAAGDITDLDVNLATIALGRARSALAAAHGDKASAIGALGAVVGAAPDDAITLVGNLRPSPLALDSLQSQIAGRADLRALDAETREAEAEDALASANGRPELGVWVGYSREETDSIVLAGLTVTLPAWNRGQGEHAAARAKRQRAQRERAAIVGVATRGVVDAFEAYARARESVEIFERDVLPVLADSEQLLDRSIASGQIAVDAFLVARQEILGGRREHLQRQLQLAKAAAWVRFVAGMRP